MLRKLLIVALMVGLSAPAGCATHEDERAWRDAKTAFDCGDYPSALPTARRLAESGSADAQYMMARMYLGAHGMPIDVQESLRWLRRAASQDHAGAEQDLGSLYLRGIGVEKDDVAAVAWFRRSATHGDNASQWTLCSMLIEGAIVPQNFEEAASLCRKAVRQGNPFAMDSLAELYRDGRGVRQDYVRAFMWWSLNVSRWKAPAPRHDCRDVGDENAQRLFNRWANKLIESVDSKRNAIRGLMTPAQVAEAERLAQMCSGSDYQHCGEPGEERK